jgi:phosphate uptake regulator
MKYNEVIELIENIVEDAKCELGDAIDSVDQRVNDLAIDVENLEREIDA